MSEESSYDGLQNTNKASRAKLGRGDHCSPLSAIKTLMGQSGGPSLPFTIW